MRRPYWSGMVGATATGESPTYAITVYDAACGDERVVHVVGLSLSSSTTTVHCALDTPTSGKRNLECLSPINRAH